MAEAAQVNHYAILIGINAYRQRPLKGCVNDVHNIEDYLKRKVYPIDIRSFTATASTDPNRAFVEEDDALPTYENVMAALRHVRETAKAGDCVYIHYSGHGTQTPPDEDEENTVTNRLYGDLALCLLDEYWPGETEPGDVLLMEGRRFAGAMNGLVAKGVVLTVVLDCCYSASVYRGDNDGPEDLEEKAGKEEDETAGRYLPWALIPKKRNPRRDEVPELDTSVSKYRDVSMSPSWLIDPKGYSLIVACGPHEVASEMSLRGQSYGKLSYFLHGIFKDCGPYRQQKAVYHHLQVKFREGTGRLKQTPVLYGNKDQTFFGKRIVGRDGNSASLITRIPVSVDADGQGTIEMIAGEAQGMSVGDTLFLYPTSVSHGAPGPDVGAIEATIDTMKAVTSILKVVDPSAQQSQQLASFNWEAEPRARRRLRDFPIHLDSSLEALDVWRGCLAKNLLIECATEDQPGFRVRLGQAEGKENKAMYQILEPSGDVVTNLPPMPKDKVEIDDVAAVLAHVINYKLIRSISSTSLSADEDDFRNTFEICIKNREGTAFEAGRVVEVHEPADRRWTIELFVKNNGTAALYVYVYSLGSRWQVEPVSFASMDVVPSKNQLAGSASFSSNAHSKKLRTMVPEAMRASGSCEDVMKIFVTSHPTLFDLLELPVIGLLQKEIPPSRDTVDSVELPERWAVFDFPIRTRCD